MKFLLVVCLAFVAASSASSSGHVAPRGIGVIISLITDITDLALKITNVVTDGCVYRREICTYEKEIDDLEKYLQPKFVILDDLDKKNKDLYEEMSKALAYQDDLARQSSNVAYLVKSVTRKIGDPALYDGLAKEFEDKTNQLLETYRLEVEAMRKAAVTKLTVLAVVDGAKLLYHGLKFAYNTLKSKGIIKRPSDFKNEITKTNPIELALKPLSSTRFDRAKNRLSRISEWWNKPNIKKIRGYVKEAGVVVGSLFSLGVSLAVDITQANKMAESMKNTRDELEGIKRDIGGQIAMEQTSYDDLIDAFKDAREAFLNITVLIKDQQKGFDSITTSDIPDANELTKKQKELIDEFVKMTEQLVSMDLNAEIQAEIVISVDYRDSLGRIASSIKRKGWGVVSESAILKVIAINFADRPSYDGRSLAPYRV